MRSFQRRTLAVLGTAALTLSAVLPAQAGPAQVVMNAGGCAGLGNSGLSYPYAYVNTLGCSGSSRYLSGSMAYSNGPDYDEYLPGAWVEIDIAWGGDQNPNSGYAVAAAATHNLGYFTSVNGFAGTNTW